MLTRFCHSQFLQLKAAIVAAVALSSVLATPVPSADQRHVIEARRTKLTSAQINSSFNSKAPQIMQNLQNDLGLTANQAAGLVGNLGTESNG